ncbi:hypothetical protein LXL04_020996 [Taraxacum kok-saghyz]
MHGGFGKQKLDSPENLGVDVAQNDEEFVDKEFADEELLLTLDMREYKKKKNQRELSLEVGLKKFPNSAILHEWMLKKKELFHEPHDDEVANETSETKTESDNESSDNEIEDGDEDVGVSHHSPAPGVGHHSPVAFETPQPVREEEITFTQVLDQPGVAEEVSAMVDQTEEASLKNKEKNNSPNFLYLPNRYSFQKTDFGTLQNIHNKKDPNLTKEEGVKNTNYVVSKGDEHHLEKSIQNLEFLLINQLKAKFCAPLNMISMLLTLLL